MPPPPPTSKGWRGGGSWTWYLRAFLVLPPEAVCWWITSTTPRTRPLELAAALQHQEGQHVLQGPQVVLTCLYMAGQDRCTFAGKGVGSQAAARAAVPSGRGPLRQYRDEAACGVKAFPTDTRAEHAASTVCRPPYFLSHAYLLAVETRESRRSPSLTRRRDYRAQRANRPRLPGPSTPDLRFAC